MVDIIYTDGDLDISYFNNVIWRWAVLLVDASHVQEVNSIFTSTILFALITKVELSCSVCELVCWDYHLMLIFVEAEWCDCVIVLIVVHTHHL